MRERQRFSLEHLAEVSGVPAPTLAALEQGHPGITTAQLDDVASALELDLVALLSGREVARPVPSIFMRHTPMQDFDYADAAVLDDAIHEARQLTDLHTSLRERPWPLEAALFVARAAAADSPSAPAKDGYRLAREVRHWLSLDGAAAPDARALLEERFGIAVLVRAFKSTRVTAVGVRSGPAAAVVLRAGDPERAKNPLLARVHLAHELCHLLFDPSTGGLHIVIDAVADRVEHAAEQRARAFAAEFLLPLEGLTALFGPPLDVNETSKALELVARARSHFGTPHEIAAHHLCNMHFVDARLRDWLRAATTTFVGSAPATSLPGTGAPSRQLLEYAERAHRDAVLTDGEARVVLGLDRLAPLPWDVIEP